MLKTLLLSLSLVALSNCALANTLVLNYDGFFDRMEDLNEPEYTGVKLAFYLTDKSSGLSCDIESATLETKLKTREIYVLEGGEILLPYDKQLDLDKAKVVLKQKGQQECGLDMRLESNGLLSAEISSQDITTLTDKFDAALEELGGMMSFLLPDVVGVQYLSVPDKALSVTNTNNIKCDLIGCIVEKASLGTTDSITFNYAPVKAVPFIKPKS